MGRILPDYNDNRSFEEQMKDLGVDIVKNAPVVVNVQWFPKLRKLPPRRKDYDISVSRTGITFSEEAHKTIGTDYVIPGVGTTEKDKKPVLLISPAAKDNKGAYKITVNKVSRRLAGKAIITRLLAEGLVTGKYTLLKGEKAFAAILAQEVKANG